MASMKIVICALVMIVCSFVKLSEGNYDVTEEGCDHVVQCIMSPCMFHTCGTGMRCYNCNCQAYCTPDTPTETEVTPEIQCIMDPCTFSLCDTGTVCVSRNCEARCVPPEDD